MKITKITPQIKSNSRYNIFIDDDYFCSISANDLLELKIGKGDKISDDKLKNLKILGAQSLLNEKLLWYLSIRPRSIFETKNYIKKKIYENKDLKEIGKEEQVEIIEKLVEKLKSLDYLNDQKFTDWFIKQRLESRNPKSISHIKSELYVKGIDRDTIETLIPKSEESRENDKKNATYFANKKFKSLKKSEKKQATIKQKLINHLNYKGFSWDIIKSAVDSIINAK